MIEVREFFRHCPNCGKRFHIKLVGEKLVDEKKQTFTAKEAVPVLSPTTRGYVWSAGVSSMPLVLEQDVPKTVDIREFEHAYKCKHCGHQWAEMHEEQSNL